jgi:hypothetical protein
VHQCDGSLACRADQDVQEGRIDGHAGHYITSR